MRAEAVRTPAEVESALPTILEHLHGDGLIAYPTETVYGFGGLVTARAAARLRTLKRRDASKPFLILVDRDRLLPGIQWSGTARTLASIFWPGPLTLILPAAAGAFPEGVVAPDGNVALRASPHPLVQALTRSVGAVTSSSANAPGSPPARDAAGLERALRELAARDVLVLDGGELPPSAPSTILAPGDAAVRVVREGAITRDQLIRQLAGTGIDVLQ